MTYNRRDVLVGGMATAFSAAAPQLFGQSVPASVSGDKVKSEAALHALQDEGLLDADLQLLLRAQEFATPVPADPKAFSAHIKKSPILQAMKSGRNTDHHHLMQWHAFLLDLTALDHTPLPSSASPAFAEQFGPVRTIRAFAIFHLAVFEAVNAIYDTRKSYRGVRSRILADAGVHEVSPATASVSIGMAYAALDTLTVLYKNKSALTIALFDEMVLLAPPATPAALALGAKIGKAAAKEILAIRGYDPATGAFSDGSSDVAGEQSLSIEPTYAELQAEGLLPLNPTPLDWQMDPIVPNCLALGGHWSQVTPFVLDPANVPIPPTPPLPGSKAFQAAYADVRAQGGDPAPPNVGSRVPTGTTRTGGPVLNSANHTFTGVFWGYDATALLCAPPRLYNMVATSIALQERPITHVNEMAFYLALVNLAMADAGIAAWTGKYHYHIARPVTYIREVEPDSVILGTANKNWTPLGSPDTNGPITSSNFTPPFPAYPSGHATFGGALFQVLRRYYKTAQTGEPAFRFISDEYNGVNKDAFGVVRPLAVRDFPDFSFPEYENARSRIWNGVHWQFDADGGTDLGHLVGDYVFDNGFTG